VRWADDCIVTANAREVLADVILPRINAFLAERGVRVSTEKTVITPIAPGVDCLGQTLRKPERPQGNPAKRQITPSQARFRAIKSQVNTLGQQAAGVPAERLLDRLTPILRGWAHDHRAIIGSETCAQLESVVWRRLFRWAKRRHPNKTGHWIATRYVPHRPGEAWRFTDPVTGKQLIRVREAVKPQRQIKVKGDANPFDRAWEAYVQHRERHLAQQASSAFRANILRQQHGRCTVCRQVIQREEHLERPHRDGNHQHNPQANLVLLHPNCHRQGPYAPDSTTASSRPARGVGHA
jgi:RNA-directed DNA polymerase